MMMDHIHICLRIYLGKIHEPTEVTNVNVNIGPVGIAIGVAFGAGAAGVGVGYWVNS